jgi:hypothetical protein
MSDRVKEDDKRQEERAQRVADLYVPGHPAGAPVRDPAAAGPIAEPRAPVMRFHPQVAPDARRRMEERLREVAAMRQRQVAMRAAAQPPNGLQPPGAAPLALIDVPPGQVLRPREDVLAEIPRPPVWARLRAQQAAVAPKEEGELSSSHHDFTRRDNEHRRRCYG